MRNSPRFPRLRCIGPKSILRSAAGVLDIPCRARRMKRAAQRNHAGSKIMKSSWRAGRQNRLSAIIALAVSMLMAGGVAAATATATPAVDEGELATLGFKMLTATTKPQQEWVKGLAPGQIRPMQRNGKKYFIYPAKSGNQVYVGGSQEYAAYRQRHPDHKQTTQQTADQANAYRLKQQDVMQKATARTLSDPFLGASWGDLGW
jgi:uncharacterized membrane protein